MPVISVGMPVFNCENTVAEAVASVLNQRYENWDLTILDDGSQDRTVEVVMSFRDPRIRVIVDGLHRGIAARRNQLIDLATGEYIAWVDADDIAYPERLDLQLSYLCERPEIDLLGSSMVMFRNKGEPFAFWRTNTIHSRICGPPWAVMRLAQPTWMGRRKWFRRHKYCEGILSGAEDRELLSRTSHYSLFAALPDALVGYREDKLHLAKWLPRRRDAISFLFRDQSEHHGRLKAGIVVAAELAKGALDILAMSTPLGYCAVPHRHAKLSGAVANKWYEVWEKCRSIADSTTSSVRSTG